MKDKVSIYIAAHKKFKVPSNDIYIPLHVGAKGKKSLGYTFDCSGDNISLTKYVKTTINNNLEYDDFELTDTSC